MLEPPIRCGCERNRKQERKQHANLETDRDCELHDESKRERDCYRLSETMMRARGVKKRVGYRILPSLVIIKDAATLQRGVGDVSAHACRLLWQDSSVVM